MENIVLLMKDFKKSQDLQSGYLSLNIQMKFGKQSFMVISYDD